MVNSLHCPSWEEGKDDTKGANKVPANNRTEVRKSLGQTDVGNIAMMVILVGNTSQNNHKRIRRFGNLQLPSSVNNEGSRRLPKCLIHL